VHLTIARLRENCREEWNYFDSNRPDREVDFCEGDACTLRLEIAVSDLPCSGDAVRLKLSGAELSWRRYEESAGLLRVEWEWKIDFYAGEIGVDLLVGNRPLQSMFWDVRPHPGKLGRDAYRELIADLWARADNVIFGATAAQRSVAEADVCTPPIGRLAMLQASIRDLERCFATIALSPNRRLVAEREARPLDRARRIDAKAFRGIVKSPSALAAMGLIEQSGTRVLERPTVDHPRREHTFNTPPNRHVSALLRRMQSQCRDLYSALANLASVSGDDADAQGRALALGREAEELRLRLHRLSCADFLDNVQAASGDTAAMIAVAKDPAYSRFDRLASRVLRPRLSLGEAPSEKLWLRRTYELYECWCFFCVAESLAKALGDCQWRSSVGPVEGSLFADLPNGCHIEGKFQDLRVRLTYQPTFLAYRPSYDNGTLPYSISGERRPDLVLSIDNGSKTVMVVLDAKYRSRREGIHEALADMHVYRDSLKVSGGGAKLLAAYILTPAHDADTAVYFTDQYRQRYRIGGFDLAPNHDGQAAALCQHLKALIFGQLSAAEKACRSPATEEPR
jgi:hypothetical protein